MGPLEILLLFGIGILAGFLNVTAGGGSLLTLPILIFLGLPSATANATNRISLIFQNISGSAAFTRNGRLPWRLTLRLAAAAFPAALVGAWLAVEVDDRLFQRILAFAMLVILIPIARNDKKALRKESLPEMPHPLALTIAFFGLGFYSGFLQAGIGFFLIACLVQLGGLDLVRTNAVKISVVLLLQLGALAVFQRAGVVDWPRGLSLAAGSMIGAWISAHAQMRHGVVWIRRFLIVTVLLFAIRLFQQSFS